MNFRSSTNKEIARVVRNFNQKISRLEKLGRENLPEKVTIKELKSKVYNSNDLKRELNKLKRFSKRGAEDVITSYKLPITNWEKRNIEIEVRTAKAKITRQLKNLGVERPKGMKKFQTGKLATNEVQTLIKQYERISTKKILQAETMSEKKELLGSVDKYNYRYSNRSLFNLKQSMLEMVDKMVVDKDNEDLKKELKKKINTMSIKDFKSLYYEFEDVKDFIERYKLEKEGLELDYGEASNELIINNLIEKIARVSL